MLKLIAGIKGTGKTKILIDLLNSALEVTKGDVVCIEKGTKLRYDIKSSARLVDVDEYMVNDAQSLFGFVAGMLAANHDVTDLFIDGTLKICNQDIPAFEKMARELAGLSDKLGTHLTMTVSMHPDTIPADLKKYVI